MLNPNDVQPGDPLAVWVGPIKHVGIASDRYWGGKPMVISNSMRAGEAREEPWDVFAGGREVFRDSRVPRLPRHVVVARARAKLGRSWRPWWNCEHFVNEALGRPSRSPQLRAGAAVALLAVLFLR